MATRRRRAANPLKVPFLVAKPLAGGKWAYYWQPSATLKAGGWKPLTLPETMEAAVAAANARNEEVARWRAGGAKPREVRRFVQAATMAGLIETYRASDKYASLAPATRATYSSALNLIERWATEPKQPGGHGNMPVAAITDDRVAVLRDALMQPDEDGNVQHHRAHATLRVLHTLLAFAVKPLRMIDRNPATAFDLAAPPPRDQIWEQADIDAFKAAAIAIGYPSLAFAVDLAVYTGQRPGDVRAFTSSNWRPIYNLDPETRRALAGADGKVMGIELRQQKTKRWVGIPIVGDLRDQVERALAANARLKVPTTMVLVNDRTGRPWQKRAFICRFAEARDRAIADGHAALAILQFRDLRRTCVVRLGELGLEDALIAAITGHKLESVKRILEVYMPRTTKMAARAIVARIGHGKGPEMDDAEKQA